MDEENHFSESDSEESYSFLRETVKKRPLRLSRILLKALMFLGAGALFGAAAAFVFWYAIRTNPVISNISEVQNVQTEPAVEADETRPTEQDGLTEQPELIEQTELTEPSEQSEPTEQTEQAVTDAIPAEQTEQAVTDVKPTEDAAAADPDAASEETDQAVMQADPAVTEKPAAGEEGQEGISDMEPVGSSEETLTDEEPETVPDGQLSYSGIPGEEGPKKEEILSDEAEAELNADVLNDYRRLNTAIRGVAEEAGKSLVQVTGITDSVDWFSNINSASKTGSGVIIEEKKDRLMILTYSNLVEDAGRLVVTMKDQSVHAAQVVGMDQVTNLAVVSMPYDSEAEEGESEWTPVNIGDSAEIHTGDSVIAIGNPLGYSNSVVYGEVTSTSGHVSLTDSEYGLITTNCVGSDLGSGILIDLDGQAVGFIMQQYSDEKWPLITAVPFSSLKDITGKLSEGKEPGYVGLKGESVTVQVADGIDVPAGVYITEVEPDSPALAAGIMPGDVLTKIGDLEIADMRTVSGCVLEAGPNQDLEFTVLRRGAEKDVEFSFTVTVGELT